MVNQINSHTYSSNASNRYQSAYTKFHSTETALLKIHNDVLASLDARKITALTLTDVFAAFDTTDHTIFSGRLDDWFCVTGKAIDWFKWCQTERCQRIKISDCLTSNADLNFGIPRGSLLGPLLFTLYTTLLSSMISAQPIPHRLYADHRQLYVSFEMGDSAE